MENISFFLFVFCFVLMPEAHSMHLLSQVGEKGRGGGREGTPVERWKMGVAPFTLALILLSVGVDGVKRDGMMPVPVSNAQGNQPYLRGVDNFHDTMEALECQDPKDVPPDFLCHSCQDVSRKAEKFLADPSVYEEANKLSAGVCQIMNSYLQTKCRRLLELYLHEGVLFLQNFFLENNLCNNTGFCPVDNSTFSSSSAHRNEDLSSRDTNIVSGKQLFKGLESGFLWRVVQSPLEMSERKGCDACHAATDQICRGLEDREQQINIMKSLLNACGALTEKYVSKCKRWVFQYGPLVLANLHKFLSSEDLCHLIHMCEEPMPPNAETKAPVFGEYETHITTTS